MRRLALLGLAALLACSGNGDDDGDVSRDGGTLARDGGPRDGGPRDGGPRDGGPRDAGPMPLAMSTDAFGDGDPVPQRYRCGPPAPVGNQPGGNVTPAMTWTGGPAETMSWAVVVRDRSAGGLVHWAIYDIPLETRSIAEGVPPGYEPASPAGSKQAEIQGSGFFGYFGPCSGGRGNTYEWTLHAMPAATLPGVMQNSRETAVANAIEGMSLESASFTGTF